MSARLGGAILIALVCSTAGYGQAVAEYALQTAGSTLSGSGGPITVGGCRIDSTVLRCLSQSHPETSIAVAVGLVVVMMIWWVLKPSPLRR